MITIIKCRLCNSKTLPTWPLTKSSIQLYLCVLLWVCVSVCVCVCLFKLNISRGSKTTSTCSWICGWGQPRRVCLCHLLLANCKTQLEALSNTWLSCCCSCCCCCILAIVIAIAIAISNEYNTPFYVPDRLAQPAQARVRSNWFG